MGDAAPKQGSLVNVGKLDCGTVESGKITVIRSRVGIITTKGSRARMAAKGIWPSGVCADGQDREIANIKNRNEQKAERQPSPGKV